jgi:CHAD domain-containing protein
MTWMDKPLDLSSLKNRGDRTADRAAHARQPSKSATAERAQPILITADLSGKEAFEIIARSCVRQLRANEACARLGQDSEGVHQFRIGLRRLRVLTGAYRGYIASELRKYLDGELGWLNEQLAQARDWDVLIEKTLRRMEARSSDAAMVSEMLDAARGLRAESYAAVRSALEDPRYVVFMQKLERALGDGGWVADSASSHASAEQSVTETARKMIKRQRRKLRAFGGGEGVTPQEMHRVRILTKKLRYLTEFFRDLYPKRSTDRFIQALTKCQECLGVLNDAAVGRKLAAMLEERLRSSSGRRAAKQATSLLNGWHAARADDALIKFEACWMELRRVSARWNKRRKRGE